MEVSTAGSPARVRSPRRVAASSTRMLWPATWSLATETSVAPSPLTATRSGAGIGGNVGAAPAGLAVARSNEAMLPLPFCTVHTRPCATAKSFELPGSTRGLATSPRSMICVSPRSVRTTTVSPWMATWSGVPTGPPAPGMVKRRTSLSFGTSSTTSSCGCVGFPASATTRRLPEASKAIAAAPDPPLG